MFAEKQLEPFGATFVRREKSYIPSDRAFSEEILSRDVNRIELSPGEVLVTDGKIRKRDRSWDLTVYKFPDREKWHKFARSHHCSTSTPDNKSKGEPRIRRSCSNF